MTKKPLASLKDLKQFLPEGTTKEATKTSESVETKVKLGFDPRGVKIKIRLLKNQKGGKIVSEMIELPYERAFFETLLKELKNKLGTGGTLKEEIRPEKATLSLEIQGDHRERMAKFLETKGFKTQLI